MRGLGTGLLIALVASTAWARDKPDPLREAQKLVQGEKMLDGLKIYADQLALAQKKADIQWQQRVVRAILENIKPYMLRDRVVRAQAIEALMKPLDPKGAYAFVYAGGLAYSLLHEMTALNDRQGIDNVITICTLQTKRKGAGPYEQAMLAYAQGLKAAEAGAVPDALRSLDEAMTAARKHGWLYTVLHVGTELAATLVAKGDAGRAALALARVAQALGPRADVTLSGDWVALVKSRLEGAPEAALKPFNEFMETDPLKDTRGTGNEAPKAPGVSKLAEVWKKTPKSRPFVTATRGDSDFRLVVPFRKTNQPTHTLLPGVTHFFEGGLTVSFWDNRVRLFVADLQGWRSIPAPAFRPHPLVTYTPLPEGAIWGVNRKGQLIVKQPK